MSTVRLSQSQFQGDLWRDISPPSLSPHSWAEKILACSAHSPTFATTLQNTLAKLSTFEELCEEVASGDDGDPLFVNAWGGMRGIYKRADNMVVGKRRAVCT